MRRAAVPRASLCAALAVLVSLACAPGLSAVDRVPRPEFQSGYELPAAQNPAARGRLLEYLDLAALAVGLLASGWLALRARSREGLFLLGVLSIAYFGFFRKGCVCPIGSIQNVALSLSDGSSVLPAVVAGFFILPLLAALLMGRTFCGALCPFGALQDAVILRPLRVPRWLAVPLGFLPVVYLGLAVLFAATGAEFVVCRFDPFISLFRLGGRLESFALGACFLLLGTVVARPYCRFFCPYGVLLKWLSRISLLHLTVTPDTCVQCRLCSGSCPVDAIRAPGPAAAPASGSAAERLTRPGTRTPSGGRRALAASLLALPLLAALGAYAGSLASPALARVHPTVRLAIQVLREDSGETKTTTLESDTFRSTRTTTEELMRQAALVRSRFAWGSPVFGGFVMLVLGGSVLGTFRRRGGAGYEPDRGECLGCGRCFSSCPRERIRGGQGAEVTAKGAKT
jgi:NosR/NirI family transcriptional regulator, nitrous oxide reductase regulator